MRHPPPLPAPPQGRILVSERHAAELQRELEASAFTGRSGGGAVELVLTGKGELTSLTINPALLTEGADTVAAVVMGAYQDACGRKEKAAAEMLAKVGALPGNPLNFLTGR